MHTPQTRRRVRLPAVRWTALLLLAALAGLGLPSAVAQVGGSFDLSFSAVDSGGGTTSGGTFALNSGIGQPDAGTSLTGGTFVLAGGFWNPSTANSPQLTVVEAGTGSGTVTSSPAAINCPGTCSALFASGTSVTLTATANTGSHFTSWSGGCRGTHPTCTLILTANTSVTATFKLIADLAITKTAPPTATVGTPFNYTLVATNNGPNVSGSVMVTDTLPSSLSLNQATTTQGACTSKAGPPVKVTCNLGTLQVGASVTITLTVTPSLAGTLQNTASIASGKTFDPTPSNNKSTATTTVSSAAGPTAAMGTPDQFVSPTTPEEDTAETETD